jgi:amino acid efflux transporter
LDRSGTFLLAGAILAATVASNYGGLRVSGRVQLVLSGGVAVLLLAATLVSIPRISLENWTPFVPNGWISVGEACVLIFFAVFGWEAIAQLSAEFRDPSRDVPRSTLLSVGLITLLYVGVAAATVGTATYGTPEVNRVAVARLLANGLGIGAGTVAASMAVLISLATTNAYVAATARLGYALARDGAFPSWLDHLDERGVPARAVFTVGSLAVIGILLSYAVGWNPEDILVVPTSLGLATYIVGSAAGARLLAGGARLLAVISLLLCLVVFPFAGTFVSLPVAVGAAAWLFRRLREYSGRNRDHY